ncbi:MAG: DNA polymerase III subunit epsilon [Alphaproteobacteria bacterium]|nr:DNA polymerase III subunit epsilon [Alphaproteobacteria bacterium]
MVREIVFDTETTGFDYDKGDRLVEIGALELIDHIQSGKTFHKYINPEREVPEEVVKVHGLTYDFLKDFPTFDAIADEWLEFVGDAKLVAHNAKFDINFVNYELKQLCKPEMSWDKVIDTLEIARGMFPNARCSLDALCRRFGIDNSARTFHGALLDAQLLAEVYLELLGGKEPTLLFGGDAKKGALAADGENIERNFHEARVFAIDDDFEAEHNKFLEENIKNALWNA